MSGQDEYIAAQIDRLRQASAEVYRTAVPPDATGTTSHGAAPPSPWENPGSRSPHSSNEDLLCHHGQRNGSSDLAKAMATPKSAGPAILPLSEVV